MISLCLRAMTMNPTLRAWHPSMNPPVQPAESAHHDRPSRHAGGVAADAPGRCRRGAG
ncbi:MAG: hypothetical protein R2699_07660 [Acidimicrobiales bacterium]